jgi:hypothetical protein
MQRNNNMETLKLSYNEMLEEIQKLNLNPVPEKILEENIKKIFQNRSKEINIPSGAPIEHPLWFTPVIQGVVVNLWLDHKPNDNLRMVAIRYLKDEAEKAGEKLFIHDAIELIKSVLPDE